MNRILQCRKVPILAPRRSYNPKRVKRIGKYERKAILVKIPLFFKKKLKLILIAKKLYFESNCIFFFLDGSQYGSGFNITSMTSHIWLMMTSSQRHTVWLIPNMNPEPFGVRVHCWQYNLYLGCNFFSGAWSTRNRHHSRYRDSMENFISTIGRMGWSIWKKKQCVAIPICWTVCFCLFICDYKCCPIFRTIKWKFSNEKVL